MDAERGWISSFSAAAGVETQRVVSGLYVHHHPHSTITLLLLFAEPPPLGATPTCVLLVVAVVLP